MLLSFFMAARNSALVDLTFEFEFDCCHVIESKEYCDDIWIVYDEVSMRILFSLRKEFNMVLVGYFHFSLSVFETSFVKLIAYACCCPFVVQGSETYFEFDFTCCNMSFRLLFPLWLEITIILELLDME